MKKLALLLAFSFLVPVLAPAISHGASTDSDLAVGDPMGGNYQRKRRAAKPATPATPATPASETKPTTPATPATPATPK